MATLDVSSGAVSRRDRIDEVVSTLLAPLLEKDGATIEVVGFWIASAVFLTVSFIALNKSRWHHAIAITAVTLATVYLLFVYVFRIYLP